MIKNMDEGWLVGWLVFFYDISTLDMDEGLGGVSVV